MPCVQDCELRQLILIKEDKISNLQQALGWVDELGRQEPHRGAEVAAKRQIVNNKIAETMAEIGILNNIIAHGCDLCYEEWENQNKTEQLVHDIKIPQLVKRPPNYDTDKQPKPRKI